MKKKDFIAGIAIVLIASIIGLSIYFNSPVGKLELKKWEININN